MNARTLLPLISLAASFMVPVGLFGEPQHDHAAPSAQHENQPTGHESMPGMDMSGAANGAPNGTDDHAQSGAMQSMQPGHHMNGRHMRMTATRQPTPEDLARADQIATTLRAAIEPYRDYHVALADGYRIFLPNVPQEQYHFTNYWNG